KQEKQTLEGLRFNIGEKLILLANNPLKGDLPEKVEGIKVDAKFAKLHVLHATCWWTDENTVVARYVVRYADKSEENIDVVFGMDVRDWGTKTATRNRPAAKSPGRAPTSRRRRPR